LRAYRTAVCYCSAQRLTSRGHRRKSQHESLIAAVFEKRLCCLAWNDFWTLNDWSVHDPVNVVNCDETNGLSDGLKTGKIIVDLRICNSKRRI